MITSIQERGGLLYARLRWRSAPGPVSFPRMLTGGGNVLVALPPEAADEMAAQPVLQLLRDRVGEERMTIAVLHQAVTTARMLPDARYVQLFPPALNSLRIPRAAVIGKAREPHHTLAVDLCLDFLLPPAYIVRASDARVRIGFAKRGADVFYNFVVQTDPSHGRTGMYERLAQCLEMFS